jgi:aminopeptidase N
MTTSIKPAILVLCLAAYSACSTAPEDHGRASEPNLPRDVHSYAEPEMAAVTHVALDLTPDFAAKKLRGTAQLRIRRQSGADSIVLDVRNLAIQKVTDEAGAALAFNVGEAKEFLGSPLSVPLPAKGDTIVITYETAPDAAAVQWLSPEQTAGKKLPFLFTQGQAILTRTWVPTQDSPGIRQTYDATIRVPAGMRAVMSAEHLTPEGEKDPTGLTAFRFRMDKPIPPYLFALAVGDIAFKAVGKNTGVYAEPSVVDRAANEFAEMDAMVAAAEKLYGPYRWGRFDVLVLPPSFPFGGMENPTLTFATPTIVVGDRSLVNLIAHELAHSWSGNLVTNATWDDFWLNEGFTSYIEVRIMEALRGKEYADMLHQISRQDMQNAVDSLGGSQAPDTSLRLNLKGKDPDDGMTDIAYEKGSAFLQTVESVTGRERLDAFLRDYFDRFAFQPMTSERLLAEMKEKLLQPGEAERIGLEAWVFQPGVPSNIPPVQSKALAAINGHITAWKNGAPASSIDASKWSTLEWLHFLRALTGSIPEARLAELDRTFKLSSSGNSEVLFAWLRVAIANRYQPAFPALERFLTSQGRRKFVAPLFADLAKTDWGKAMALDIYKRARPTYHSVSVNTIDQTLK